MHLSASQFRALDRDSLKSFISLKIPEGSFLDYKLAISFDTASKKELLKDVTGFANSGGGQSLYRLRNQCSAAMPTFFCFFAN